MSKALAPSVVSTRDPMGRHFLSVVEAAYDKANLSEEEAQRVRQAASLSDLIESFIAERRSAERHRYSHGYQGPQPVEQQVKALSEIFGLEPAPALAYARNLPQLPEGAEGWFAVISPAGSRKLFPEIKDGAELHCRMIQFVNEKIAASRRFYSGWETMVVAERLKVHARTAGRMRVLSEQQIGDIIIVAAQLGLRHRGRSVRRVRETFASNEFGLTSLSAGCIILAHPERFTHYHDLVMQCAGEDFTIDNGGFCNIPSYCFAFGGEGPSFGWDLSNVPHENSGSASGFVPQDGR